VNLPHLAQRLFNTPLALHPSKAEVIMASVMDRFGISKIESSLAMEDDWYGYDDNRGVNPVVIRVMTMCWVSPSSRYAERWCKNWAVCVRTVE
jgi:hypothetical protein